MLLEGVVVVVSILIAFGLDAWWEDRTKRADFLDDLINIQQELQSNLVTVDAAIGFQEGAVASIDVLLREASRVPAGNNLTLSDTIVFAAFLSTPSYDPSTGAVDALIASGRLSDLDDPELKAILTDFRTAVLDIREDELAARSAAHDKILPLFWENADLGSAFEKVNDYYREGRGAMRSEPVELVHVAGLANRLHLRRAWLISAARALRLHRERLARAEVLLRAQLGDG